MPINLDKLREQKAGLKAQAEGYAQQMHEANARIKVLTESLLRVDGAYQMVTQQYNDELVDFYNASPNAPLCVKCNKPQKAGVVQDKSTNPSGEPYVAWVCECGNVSPISNATISKSAEPNKKSQ